MAKKPLAFLLICVGLMTCPSTVRSDQAIALAPPEAKMRINYAVNSNVKVGDVLRVGLVAATGQNGFLNADAWDWGVSKVMLFPNSSVSIQSFGYAIAGGRVLELSIKGKARIFVRYLTQSSSKVKACFNNRGCIILRSAANVKEIEDGRFVVGLIEGHGIAQDYEEKTPVVELLPHFFSIMAIDGSFSPAKKVDSAKGYRIFPQTRTMQILRAEEGYEIVSGRFSGKWLQLSKNARFKIVTPLD
jgi:hypothetical protein